MRLYVPSLGDQLRLSRDWTFDLYREHRNETLWSLLKCDSRVTYPFADECASLRAQMAELEARKVKTPCRHYDWGAKIEVVDGQSRYFRQDWASKADKTAWELALGRLQQVNGQAVARVTLPAQTLLKVDRIYIRKGAEDFSSITFYARSIPGHDVVHSTKKTVGLAGRTRFWAKLEDCNRIEFERVD